MPSDTRILAIETSSRHGSIALLTSSQVAAQYDLPTSVGTAQCLIPAIADALHSLDWTPSEIQLVAITVGPGSFTGLRVGVTTAKAFAYAASADVIAVDTLDCIAARAIGHPSRLHVVIDAQRGDFFAATYRSQQNSQPQLVERGRIVSQRDWLGSLESGDTVIGPGLAKIKGSVPAGVATADEHLWLPLAVDVGRLAFERYQLGHRDDLWTLSPLYYRRSAAEEKIADRIE